MPEDQTREGWLNAGIAELKASFFDENGYELPKMRVSCGFPRGHAKAIGQCWDKVVSGDDTYEMFICPTQDEPVTVLAILLHEMIHASVGIEAGHKGPFRGLAKEFGLAGKMTATFAEVGSDLHTTLTSMAHKLGEYPHKRMVKKEKPKKPNIWQRFKSTNEETFKLVARMDKVEEFGAPRDPWGDEMELMNPDWNEE